MDQDSHETAIPSSDSCVPAEKGTRATDGKDGIEITFALSAPCPGIGLSSHPAET